eukprot:m.257819 g.257819  ORF g.257819 m.257819 type:complete len:2371 (+) comp22712_c0_seq2:129-7241(+)
MAAKVELARIFEDLKRKEPSARSEAALRLERYVAKTARRLVNEELHEFVKQLNSELCALLVSKTKTENLGGIQAVESLVKVDNSAVNTDLNLNMFGRYLSNVLPPFVSDTDVIAAAVGAIGLLARRGMGPLTPKFVTNHADKAMEWLEHTSVRSEAKRMTAALVLEALATTQPVLIYSYIPRIFTHIFVVLYDPKATVRQAGARALRASLQLWRERSLYPSLYRHIEKGFLDSKEETVHGALLAAAEFLEHTGDYIKETTYYQTICDALLKTKDHRSSLVQRTTLHVVCLMAELRPDAFSGYHTPHGANYSECVISFIVRLLQKERERSFAYSAVSRLALAVPQEIEFHSERVLQEVQTYLKKTRNIPEELLAAICSCVGNVCVALGSKIQRQLVPIIELLLEQGLSEPLSACLSLASTHLPAQQKYIQRRVLDMVSQVLLDHPYVHPGAPEAEKAQIKDKSKAAATASNKRVSVRSDPSPAPSGDMSVSIVLALRTLRTFAFVGPSLVKFARDAVVPLLTHDTEQIREEAALSCAHLVGTSSNLATVDPVVVLGVLTQLLMLTLSDRKPEIRKAVLAALPPSMDDHLADVEVLNLLFEALSDLDFNTRWQALEVVGRLGLKNPAYVVPALRRNLRYLLASIDFRDGRVLEHVQLLGHLIQKAPNVVQPYVDAVMRSLTPQFTAANYQVSYQALVALGHMSSVAGPSMGAYLDELYPVLLDTLKDQLSVSRQEVGLNCLGRLIKSTGEVITPYRRFPWLLNTVFTIFTEGKSAGSALESCRVLGILGAIDPHEEQQISLRAAQDKEDQAVPATQTEASALEVPAKAVGSEEYYQEIVVSELIQIAYAPSLSHLHNHTIRSCGIIIAKSGSRFVPYLSQMVPAFLHMISNCDPGKRHSLFKELGNIVSLYAPHMRPYLPSIIDAATVYWLPTTETFRSTGPPMHVAVMSLLRASLAALGQEFKGFVPRLLKHIMSVFSDDESQERLPTTQALDALALMGVYLEDWTGAVLAAVVNVCGDYVDTPIPVRNTAILTLATLVQELNLKEHLSSVVHSMCSVVRHEPALRDAALQLLQLLVWGLADDPVSLRHVSLIKQMLEEYNIQNPKLAELIDCVLSNKPRPNRVELAMPSRYEQLSLPAPAVKGVRASQRLVPKLATEASSAASIDWADWIGRFSIALLRESQSPALAACQELAQSHEPLARRLFSPAFLSCWKEMPSEQQTAVAEALETPMRKNPVFMQMMLNVVELMSHHQQQIELPIAPRLLGGMAFDCHAFAKALRYKETELTNFFAIAAIHNGVTPPAITAHPDLLAVVQDLIEINQELQEPEAAQGVLDFFYTHTTTTPEQSDPSWREKLGEWDEALARYDSLLRTSPDDFDLVTRRMQCLDSLGRWQDLHVLVKSKWPKMTDTERGAVAALACSAAEGTGEWSDIATYAPFLNSDDFRKPMHLAMLSIHNDQFSEAQQQINAARDMLGPALRSLWSESYFRAYSSVTLLQILSEMEEMMEYKKAEPPRKAHMRHTWRTRLQGCRRSPDVWQSVLKVRSLVLRPEEDVDMWLTYASLCRRHAHFGSGHTAALDRAHSILVGLLGCNPVQQFTGIPVDQPRVAYAYIKHLWWSGKSDAAINYILQLIDHLSASQSQDRTISADDQSLLARCYHKSGLWQSSRYIPGSGKPCLDDDIINSTIEDFHYATMMDRTWYKAWHSWAYMSFLAVSHYQERGQQTSCLNHAVMAVKGFFNSVSLSPLSNLQDTLRLLTLWFRYGGFDEVAQTIASGVNIVSVDTWLQVVPQLIARIDIRNDVVRDALHGLLMRVSRVHPQALVFPMTVAAQNTKAGSERRQIAETLLHKVREHSKDLVDQAQMVSEELIRVAILWHEMWHEGLEEASKFYMEQDYESMMARLNSLNRRMTELGPNAMEREKDFVAAFGKQLRDAWEWCRRFQRSKNPRDLSAAWEHYYNVYRKIGKTLPQVMALDLPEESPKLCAAHDLKLAVPGTYGPGKPLVTISSFVPLLTIINSKQRPRKLTIKGSDGKEYLYLLKAHEDLRQDERVMQLFGLVNVLLNADNSTAHHHLSIVTYFVLPLSPNLGLIKWVPTCDTLHSLIREHRERHRIVLNMELKLQLQMTANYDALTTIQKVEVFRYQIEKSAPDDLARAMWRHSRDSETWLERRLNYTRSLAVMSIVGYVLGLGDRHPSNLMLDRTTGNVVHVDFGDCFEIAMQRAKFPEKIPFRLTRMLVAAMGASGYEGNFRVTCQRVMTVLRHNADSVLAVLEAFVHDPLIDWFVKVRGTKMRTGARTVESEDRTEQQMYGGPGNEQLNKRALSVLGRVQAKLSGNDFKGEQLNVPNQVQRLILDATSHENLCQHYQGWCAFW